MNWTSVVKAACGMTIAVALSGCATNAVVVNYQAPPGVQRIEGATVSAGRFVDDRGEPPKWLGAIRGGFGNPLKVLETDEPVAKVVQTAFAEGLRARGAGRGSQLELIGTIKRLDCSQYVRRESHGVIEVAVFDTASGRERFRKTYTADVVDGSLMNLATGIFASTDDLRRVLERNLQQIVDQALDDPQLRAALR